MGFLSAAIEKRTSTWPTSSVTNPQAFLLGLTGASNTHSGATVDRDTAYGLPAYYACVRIISEDFAKTPVDLFKRMGAGGKRKAHERPEFRLIHDAPNPEMTAFEWKMVAAEHLLTHGNHYSRIVWQGDGSAMELWPMEPWRMQVNLVGDRRVYDYDNPATGKRETLLGEDVFHVWLVSRDGLIGISTLSIAREAIGLGLTLQEFAARFFGNGSQPTGILTHPRTLSDEAHKRLREDFRDVYSRLDQKHRVYVFEEDVKYTQVAIANEQAQFIESRMFSLREIARIFNIPPYRIGDTEKGASFASIEQQALDYYRNTQLPMMARFEQKLTQKLLTTKEAKKFFFEFNADILLRADTSARYSAHAQALQNGFLNINEVREIENRNPLPPEIGEVYRVQLNTANAGAEPIKAGKTPPENPDFPGQEKPQEEENPDDFPEKKNNFSVLKPIFSDLEVRCEKRERHYIRDQAARCEKEGGVKAFRDWFEGWTVKHRDWLRTVMAPAYEVRVAMLGPMDLDAVIEDRIDKLAACVAAGLDRDGLAGVREFFGEV